jgi:hypothetical protein
MICSACGLPFAEVGRFPGRRSRPISLPRSNNTAVRISLAVAVGVASACLLPAQAPTATDTKWEPITDAEKNLSAPIVDSNAGVEAIFWRVHVIDDMLNHMEAQRTLYHYVRLKIFNAKGVEQASPIDIQYDERTRVTGIAARTIKPDGTILELGKDAVHERDLVRQGSHKRRAKSFAMPGLEPGAIVEYRWKEYIDVENMFYQKLEAQREFPVHKVTYFIKPLSLDYTTFRMATWPFNCQPSPLKQENTGFHSTSIEKVPAFREEPLMPGEPSVRAWMLLRYQEDERRDPEKYWNNVAKKTYAELKSSLKVNDEIRAAAQKAVEGAPDTDKIVRLIRYVRENFRDLYSNSVSDAERTAVLKQMPKDRWRTAPEIFKSRIGSPNELNTLVAALALAVDIEARPARVASRNGLVFDRRLADSYFLPYVDLAVRQGDKWKIYDVTADRLPANMLSWQEEGMEALLCDPKKPEFIAAPLSEPGASTAKRTGKFKLLADGTLEGDIVEAFTGHRAADERTEYVDESETRQQEHVKDEFMRVYTASEVSGVKVENVTAPEEPLRVHYHVRIPGYAQVTGKRLFFKPDFFRQTEAPLFTNAERKYDIVFRYAWEDEDTVDIQLPEGFSLDSPENPGGLDMKPVGKYDFDLSVSKSGLLHCNRKLAFGMGGHVLFPQKSYALVKNVFDEIQRRDTTSLAIRPTAARASSR